MNLGDRVSTMLGAPPDHWKKLETLQIKQIHRCYRNAFNAHNDEDQVDVVDISKEEKFQLLFGDSMAMRKQPEEGNKKKKIPGTQNLTTDIKKDIKKDKKKSSKKDKEVEKTADGVEIEPEIQEVEDKRDEEWYLPNDSPLRSKDGDKKAPQNAVFRDYETFLHTCEFDFWRESFEQQSQDRFLAEIAETVVANICNAQSRNEMRVNPGNIPFRKKREHITPLALTLHELKLWATNVLRPASIYEEDTYKDLKYRIRYLESLSHKEVWGDAAMFLAAGMQAIAHDKLFRLLVSAKESLQRAEEYAYRGYCRRSSREKLARLGNLLKNVVLREMRVLSSINTLEQKLSNPKTARLQPADLLNTIQNQGFVDFKNMVNVLMYKLCQIPLVRVTLTSDYDSSDAKQAFNELENWTTRNLFCLPSSDGFDNEPTFLMDERKEFKLLPKIYTPTFMELKKLIKEVDPRAALPLKPKTHINMMLKAYESEEDAMTVVKLMMKTAAAIQDLIPGVYAMHQLWAIAGDGGDFTVYDTLREQVIRVMSNVIERVYTLKMTEQTLLKEIGRLCKLKEKKMEERRLKTGKARFKPAWVMNYKFLQTDLLPASQKGYNDALKQLWEIAKDAWEYNLTSEQLDDKVEACKKMCDALTGLDNSQKHVNLLREEVVDKNINNADFEKVEVELKAQRVNTEKKYSGEFNAEEIIKIGKGKKDWLHSEERSGDEAFGASNAFGDMDYEQNKVKYDFEEDDKERSQTYNPFEDAEDSDDY